MEFNARIFYARTLINDNESDIDKYYLKLIKDKKNIEKLDRIFFEIGLMYESKKNFLDAIENFSTSVDKNNNNNNLLFYAYKKTADIYYDQINNYQLAKLYYDSALTNINREFKGYNKLKEKSDVLTDLVNNLGIIETNDSLIYLTSLPEDVLNNILDKSIKTASQNKKKENSRAFQQNFLPSESKVILGNKSEGDWYFDNESLLSIGKNDFQRIWGNRELKDNWRLISKISFNSNLDIDESRTVNEENTKNKSEDEDDENTVAKLKSSLPFDQSQKDILNKETEKAYYEVGKIYIQKLNEKEKGIENYNRFIERFSKSEYLAEIYYQLYLISNEAEKYKNLILSNYSDTDYYKLIINPNYQVDEFQELNLLKKIYNNLYENLRVGNNKKVIRSVDSLSLKYIDNSFFENIQLLKSIATGKEAGSFSLQYQLKKFLKYSLEEPPVNYAKTLLNSAEEVHEKFIFSGLPVFTKNNDSVFYFFIYIDPQFKENLVNRIIEILRKIDLPEDVFEFKLKNDVTFNVISLNNREKLKFIKSEFNTSLTSEESNGNTNFVIGEKNMNLIFNSKNFTEFLKFIN